MALSDLLQGMGQGQSTGTSAAPLMALLAMLSQQKGQAGLPLPNAAPAFNSPTGSAMGSGSSAPGLQGPQMPAAANNSGQDTVLAALINKMGSGSGSGSSGGKGGKGGIGSLIGGLGKGGAGAGAGAAAGIGSDALASYGPMLADIGAAADI